MICSVKRRPSRGILECHCFAEAGEDDRAVKRAVLFRRLNLSFPTAHRNSLNYIGARFG